MILRIHNNERGADKRNEDANNKDCCDQLVGDQVIGDQVVNHQVVGDQVQENIPKQKMIRISRTLGLELRSPSYNHCVEPL